MSKPTLHPKHLDHLTSTTHIDLWHEYAKVALNACVTFHGVAGSHSTAAADIAAIADEMVVQHISRLSAHKEAQEVAREKGKGKK